jgi:hypothetical protein
MRILILKFEKMLISGHEAKREGEIVVAAAKLSVLEPRRSVQCQTLPGPQQ